LDRFLFDSNFISLFSYEDLKKIFGRYGRIVDITLPLDYYTRDAKGYGFVEYEESRDAEEALHALDRYRLLGRELEVEFARGDRKTPSEMRSREKEARYGRGGGGNFDRRDRSRSRDRRQRSGSPPARDRRRGGGGGGGSRSRSPHSRSPVPRRPATRSRSKSTSPNYAKRNGSSTVNAARRGSRSRSPVDN
jgi:FUS-interacting serine-arginine-rich protein 1